MSFCRAMLTFTGTCRPRMGGAGWAVGWGRMLTFTGTCKHSFTRINAVVSSCSMSHYLRRNKNIDVAMHIGPRFGVTSDKNLKV